MAAIVISVAAMIVSLVSLAFDLFTLRMVCELLAHAKRNGLHIKGFTTNV